MRLQFIRSARECLVVALLLSSGPVLAADEPTEPKATAPSVLDAAMAEYRLKLEDYTRAWKKYEDEATAYWSLVAEKRLGRRAKRRDHQEIVLNDYVLAQPPVYSGPPEPLSPEKVVPEVAPPPRKYIPVVTDFLKSAAEQFNFAPQMPQSEIEFKRAYAKVASAAGLTKDQVVRIYGFESGGNGRYDVQAGLEYPTPNARAISTALGYNQLLNTNSVELLAEQGDRFVKALKTKAATLQGEPKQMLEQKIATLQRMIDVAKSVPDDWNEHEILANKPPGLGIHALILDIDVGPLLQTQKLLDSVIFARNKGHQRPLTAAELEMLNLTGDGNGIDMVTMPAEMRVQVPTSNFFQPDGYEANSVAKVHNTVAELIKATDVKMDQEIKLQGARDLAAAF
jgi:hypothetical protein